MSQAPAVEEKSTTGLRQTGRVLVENAAAHAEGGTYEAYVRAFPDKGARVHISSAGGMMPVLSRNGHELFYRTEDQRIDAWGVGGIQRIGDLDAEP